MIIGIGLFGIFAVLIFAELIVLFAPIRFIPSPPENKPLVSILLVVRNEEKNIERCLRSLLDQDYENFEILIADDNSTDQTADKISEYALSSNKIKVLKDKVEVGEKQNPKAMHLHELTLMSEGEIVAVVDGDCTYQSTWLRTMVNYMGENRMISGVTGIEHSPMEDLEWKTNIGRIHILSRMGFNTSAVGNNMMVHKEDLERVGGWKKVASHITEDFALHRIFHREKIPTSILLKREVVAVSESTPYILRYNQRKRWMQGVRQLSPLIQAMIYLQSFILPLSVLAIIYYQTTAVLAIALLLGLRILSDTKVLLTLGSWPTFKVIIYQFYQLYWTFTFILYFIFGPKISWKGRKY